MSSTTWPGRKTESPEYFSHNSEERVMPIANGKDEILRDGTGFGDELTLYERKSLLVNRELDAMGLGRYQKCIWLLCGMGYFLDLLWAQAFGLVATPLYQELGVTGADQTNIFTCFSAGLTAGAFFWGLAVDIIGRKWAFNMTAALTGLFGILVAAPYGNHAYAGVCVLTGLCGFGLGGNIPIDASIVIEFLPQNRRWLLPLLSMWQPIGVVVNCAIAYGLVPRYRCNPALPACSAVAVGLECCTRGSNIGWRMLMVACGGISFTVFFIRFFCFNFLESPKFLLARGRDADAVRIVEQIAAFNRQPPPQLTLIEFEELDRQFPQQTTGAMNSKHTTLSVLAQGLNRMKNLKGLFRSRSLGYTTVLLWIVYMGDFWSFNLAGSFLPIILARRGAEQDVSVTETYRQYVYIYLPGILGTIMAAAMIELPGIGRKWTLVFGALVQGVSMAMYTQVTTLKASVGLNALEYIMQSFFNAVLYGFTPEVFPAPIRGSAAGLCSTWGRLAGIIAPIAARPYISGNSDGVLWLGVGGIFVSAFFLIFLPIETRKRAAY